jgi:acyl carrier protein
MLAKKNFKPTKLSGNLLQMSGYDLKYNGFVIYDKDGKICATFNLLDAMESKQPKSIVQKPTLLISKSEQIQSDKIAEQIAQILQSSISNNIELNESYYNVGFFDLGLDSLATIGFANQLMEAQLPRLTSAEIIANPTINKLAVYIRKKLGLYTPDQTQNCDSGYASVINDDCLTERKLSDEAVEISQLIYEVEKLDEYTIRPKFRLMFVLRHNDISIYHKYGSRRLELTFSGLNKKLLEIKPEQVEFSFKMSDFNSLGVSKLFVKLGNILIDVNQQVEIYVRKMNNLISEMAIAFLKTLCAEHPSLLSIKFYDKLRLISEENLIRKENELSNCWLITGSAFLPQNTREK